MPEPGPAKETIKCPYCAQPNTLESEFCWACFQKLHIPKEVKLDQKINRDLNRLAGGAVPEVAAAPELPGSSANPGLVFWGRLMLVCGLTLFYLQWLKDAKHFSFIDHVNLAFHEAGHIFLGFFGEFIKTAGGTVFQLLLPAVCGVHLLRRDNRLGWQLCLFWVGENFLNISMYAGDAIAQELPLVGGGVHDWTYLLTEMHLIAHTEGTGRFIFWTGSAMIFASLCLIGYDAFTLRPFKTTTD